MVRYRLRMGDTQEDNTPGRWGGSRIGHKYDGLLLIQRINKLSLSDSLSH